MKIPRDTGPIHFVGMGGIGMSGIAEVLHTLGYTVQGSDLAANANVERLRRHGIQVHVGHDEQNIGDAAVLVVSTAVKPDNPELVAARRRHIPVVRRAEMLAELMRFKSCVAIGGTHGKTTTTSMVAALLDAGKLDPTVINGGIINAYGTNARFGDGDWMVVEADESDGTFVKLPADVAIVTNIDPEHMDHYGSFEKVREAFRTFVENLPFYGFAVACLDHPEVQTLVSQVLDRRIHTYGLNPQADAQLLNLRTEGGVSHFDVKITNRRTDEEEFIDDLKLPMPGNHNALNALAAIVVARKLGVSAEMIKTALSQFGGVKRRFTHVGSWNGANIYDDYGHHPVEIAAVLQAARSATKGRVIAVMQPHRYTRLKDLFDDFCTCFNEADIAIIADVFEAGETPIEGASKNDLVQGLISAGHKDARALESEQKLPELIASIAQPDDNVICLGAGSITKWANELAENLSKFESKS